jgi:hypothetical protein
VIISSDVRVAPVAAVAMCVMALWTLAAAILGAFQLLVRDDLRSRRRRCVSAGPSDGFGELGADRARPGRRVASRRPAAFRIVGVALLLAALGKLFVYDLAFLTAMARTISFIVTGSVLLVAALLLQRFGPQVKGVLSDEQMSGEATA